jgi:hypothetical protein
MDEKKRATKPPIRPDMTVRLLAYDYPGCRDVFIRYGEPENRSTSFGHLEPLDRFARRMSIDLNRLLDELALAAGVEVDRIGDAFKHIYRPFIASALFITLTLGAGWGASLLFQIGYHRNFDAASSNSIVAHGEAQLWGFVGLFVVGIAIRYLSINARSARSTLILSRAILASLLFGVLGGFAWAIVPGELGLLGPFGGASLVVGSTLFFVFLVGRIGGDFRTTWSRSILCAAIWFVVWACATFAFRFGAAWKGPGVYGESTRRFLMESAIFGFSMNAIYGFGVRLLAGIMGSPAPRKHWIEASFWLHNIGTLLLIIGHTISYETASAIGAISLACGALSYAFAMRGFVRTRRSRERPEAGSGALRSYIQLAFFWLIASLIAQAGGDIYWGTHGLTPPHSHLGAVRHALTVGFMTTMIMGVGQRLIPILEHIILPWPKLVVPILTLIGVGNFWRVGTEFVAAQSSTAFVVMPFSSLLELSALALFAANVIRTLWPPSDPLLRTNRVSRTTSVAVLLAEHPWIEDDLHAWGLKYIGRVRSVPKELTLGSLVESEKLDPEGLITRINERLAEHDSNSTEKNAIDETRK